MKFYEKYPMMRPYVGKEFHKVGNPSLLLIGESHYVDEDSACRSSPTTWYSGASDSLLGIDLAYINTAQILEDSRADGFRNKSHSIMRNALSVINEYGPKYSDYTRVADNIAFYNFFLRPAVDGGSLKHELCAQDIEVANEAFRLHFDALKPSAVIFLSILARDKLAAPVRLPVP